MLFGRYASRKSEARYPSLWDGLVGAWCPSVQGPSGVNLYDLSGRNQHGAISNATLWERSGGRHALSIGGTPAIVQCGANIPITGNVPLYLAAWCRPATSSGLQILCGKYTDLSATQEVWIEYARGAATFNVISGGGLIVSSSVCSPGQSYHVCVIRTGATGAWTYRMVINGRLNATATTSVNPAGNGSFTISNATFPFSGAVDDVQCGRSISLSAAMLLTSRRGIAFEPRRSISVGSAFRFRRNYSQIFTTGVLG